jgi:hypothetical protein
MSRHGLGVLKRNIACLFKEGLHDTDYDALVDLLARDNSRRQSGM